MVLRRPLIAVSVVAGETSHQLLGIFAPNVEQEAGSRGATENPGRPPVVHQFDITVLA